MNNEGKLFQQKQSLETLFLLMKKTRAKKFKVRVFYHLQNLFWGVLSGAFLAWEFLSGALCPGGFCLGVFCSDTVFLLNLNAKNTHVSKT